MPKTAYNAKPSLTSVVSPLAYTIYGVHTYPRYLTEKFAPLPEAERHLNDYIDKLEDEVARAKEARDTIRGKLDLVKQHVPIHPKGFGVLQCNDLLDALSSGDDDGVMEEIQNVGGAYMMKVLDETVCAKVIEEVKAYGGRSSPDEWGPHGTKLVDMLFNMVMKPLGAMLWPEVCSDLTMRYSFTAHYTTDAQAALDLHSDDSELTLTVQLTSSFTGAGVTLNNTRSHPQEGTPQTTLLHNVVGTALLHLGQHLHEVQPIESGERIVLVIWARSASYRDRHCPCCARFRRNRCLMKPEWPYMKP